MGDENHSRSERKTKVKLLHLDIIKLSLIVIFTVYIHTVFLMTGKYKGSMTNTTFTGVVLRAQG